MKYFMFCEENMKCSFSGHVGPLGARRGGGPGLSLWVLEADLLQGCRAGSLCVGQMSPEKWSPNSTPYWAQTWWVLEPREDGGGSFSHCLPADQA